MNHYSFLTLLAQCADMDLIIHQVGEQIVREFYTSYEIMLDN